VTNRKSTLIEQSVDFWNLNIWYNLEFSPKNSQLRSPFVCECFCYRLYKSIYLQELLRQVQAERDELAARLDALTEQHSRMISDQQDRTELVEDDKAQSAGDGDGSSTSGILTWEQLTPQIFVQLQNNFSALQVSKIL